MNMHQLHNAISKKPTTTDVENAKKFLQMGVYKIPEVTFLFNLSLVKTSDRALHPVWVLGFKKDEGKQRESERRQSKQKAQL